VTTPPPSSLLRALFARSTVLRALRVTGVIAPTLIAINHATCVVDGTFSVRCLLQSILTTLVPYCVSSYSSARASLERGHSPIGN
jgi:hypothetical protein